MEACEPSDLVGVLRATPEVEKGFLCHRDSHCFALRPLHGQWSSSRFKAPPLPCLGRPCHAWGAPALRRPRSPPESHVFHLQPENRWNLDSKLKHPQLVKPELLIFFLAMQRATGYVVYVVRGSPLPPPRLSSRQSLSTGCDKVRGHLDLNNPGLARICPLIITPLSPLYYHPHILPGVAPG